MNVKKKMFALPYIIWMILFTVVPLILVLIYAFVDMTDTGNVVITLDYIKTAFSADNITVLLRSLEYALITTNHLPGCYLTLRPCSYLS